MRNGRGSLWSLALVGAAWAVQPGCTPLSVCGCRSTPKGTVSGRLTDPDGRPVAGVEVWAVQESSAEADPIGLVRVAKGFTGRSGSYGLSVPVGRFRILVRSPGYQPRLGPEFEMRGPGSPVSGLNLELIPARPSTLRVHIAPIQGREQLDSLALDQVLTAQGLEFILRVASGQPSLGEGRESMAFQEQPPGQYLVSLSRREISGPQPHTAVAQASLALADGQPADLPLRLR